MKVLVLNGPNLNLLGTREPEVYGSTTLADLDGRLAEWGAELDVVVETFQSNHEGALIDRIHRMDYDGLVINPGALTHYSYALHDALVAVGRPAVEVHISNIHTREEWRRASVTAPACAATIFGRGIAGYRWALRHLVHRAAFPVTEVRYGSAPDQTGDLRLPAGPAPHPLAVLLHGGFWSDEWTRDTLDGIAVDLARRGWATWNLEYHRVGRGGGWPVTLRDVAVAVDHVAALTPDVDPARVVLVGHSAGGQLALWAAGRHRLPVGAPGAEPRIRPVAAVGLAPVADLAEAHRLDLDEGAVERFLRRAPTDPGDRYATASPVSLLPLGVPQLIVHGDADDRVPVEMSRAYAGAAADAGDRVEYHEFEGVDHYELIDPSAPAWRATAAEIDQLVTPAPSDEA